MTASTRGLLRLTGLMLMLPSCVYAADTPQDLETVKRAPSTRPLPLSPRLRFEPRPDMTAEELDRLEPYLKGKPLSDEDRKTLGSAMRHLRETD